MMSAISIPRLGQTHLTEITQIQPAKVGHFRAALTPWKRELPTMEYLRQKLTRKGPRYVFCDWNTGRPTLTGINTASSVSITSSGEGSWMSVFVRSIGPVRSSLSIMPARPSR